MSTIAAVSADRGDSEAPGGADILAGHDLLAEGAGERSAERLTAVAERRSLLVAAMRTLRKCCAQIEPLRKGLRKSTLHRLRSQFAARTGTYLGSRRGDCAGRLGLLG